VLVCGVAREAAIREPAGARPSVMRVPNAPAAVVGGRSGRMEMAWSPTRQRAAAMLRAALSSRNTVAEFVSARVPVRESVACRRAALTKSHTVPRMPSSVRTRGVDEWRVN